MIGRFLCSIGLHRWEFRDEYRRTITLTWVRCRRGCWRYDEELVANVDPVRECICTRHAFPSPLCPKHGLKEVA